MKKPRPPVQPVPVAELAEECCYNIGRCLVLIAAGEVTPVPGIIAREIWRRRGQRWAHVQAADPLLAVMAEQQRNLGTTAGWLVYWLIEAQRNPLRNLDLEQAAVLAKELCDG